MLCPTVRRCALTFAFLLGAGACEQRPRAADQRPPDDALAVAHVTAAAAAYDRALAGAQQLEREIEAFMARPTPAGLIRARAAWVAARATFAPTEAFRFSGGPIDAVEPRIDAWPIDESLIDAVKGAPGAGIINDPQGFPVLSADRLAALNESEGETSVTTGYHAIEFLLWGQDLRPDGPGARPFTDYLPSAAGGARRGVYLREVTALLVRDLASVAHAWSPAGEHRRRFLNDEGAVGKAWQGTGTFLRTELAGERMTVAYETKEQEDETSCFSDNTTNDIVLALAGVEALLRGSGWAERVAAAEPELARRLLEASTAALAAARAIPAPFDQAIRGDDRAPGRRALARTIAAVLSEADLLDRARRVVTP
jgi:putative iron-regulated protein